jgi:hypothetical protein
VTCAAWFPDGRRLATGSHDKQLCVVSLDGTVERQWRIQRVQEVLVAKGGRYILVSRGHEAACVLYVCGGAGNNGGGRGQGGGGLGRGRARDALPV